MKGDRLLTEMVYPHTDGYPLSTNPEVNGRESNSRPVDHKTDALTTAPPRHPLCTVVVVDREQHGWL